MAIKISGTSVINDSLQVENITHINGTAIGDFLTSAGGTVDISGESVGDLSDVVLGTLSTGEVLIYNGTNWVNTNVSYNDLVDLPATFTPSAHTHTLSDITDAGTAAAAATTDFATAAQGATADSALQDITGENLGDLSDVTITGAATGEFLRYNGSAWVDATIADGDIAQSAVTQHQAALTLTESQISDLQTYLTNINSENIGDLADVTISTVATGDLIRWNGSGWVNVNLSEAGIAASSHNHDSDYAALSHNHDGTYEPADATILKDADIGVNVQGYSAVLAGTTASFTTADETKLDAIEAGADVTDTTNVEAAGALMDSEVTNLAQVKAFDSSDYATAAQGTLADNAIPSSEKGSANGVATLDGSGLVPSSQLPSYVDDVLEYANEASFPATGETGKLYVDTSDNSVHRWSGSAYVNVTNFASPTHTHTASEITDFDTEVSNNTDVAANTTKLAGIEAGATADQTGAEIKTALFAESDTNNYDDAAVSKLAGIEAGATADQTGAEIKTALFAETDTNNLTDTLKNKLDGIEAGATGDQTDAEIRAAVAAATDSNVLTDTLKNKLDGIEASADVTDTTNVEAAGALMDSEVTNLAQVKAFNSADYATAAQGTTADSALQDITGENLEDLSNVTISTPSSGQVLKYNGSAWVNDTDAGGTTINALDDVADVTVTSIASGEILKWNGSAWVNNTLAEAGIQAAGSYADASHNHDGTYEPADATILKDADIGVTVQAYDANVNAINQALASSDAPTFAGLTANGNITTTGTVDGRDVAADGTKLDTMQSNLDTTDSPTFAGATINGNITTTGTVDGRDLAADGTKLDGMQSALGTADSPTFAGMSLTGNVTTTGTVDGRDLAADGTKLDGMQSGLDTTDSPTFAGGTFNGNIATTGTVDGRDVATDGTKLDGISAGADVTSTAIQSESIKALSDVDSDMVPTDGQVLTWNNTAAEWQALAASGGAGGTLQITAAETLTAGDLVAVDANGQAELIEVAGASSTFTDANNDIAIAVDEQNSCVSDDGSTIVVIYNNSGVYVRAGSVSGTTITWGTAVQVQATNYSNYPDIAWVQGQNGFVVAFNQSNFKMAAGTVSGTAITMGSVETVSTGGASPELAVWNDGTNDMIVGIARGASTPYRPYATAYTMSGTTLTKRGTSEDIAGANMSSVSYAGGAYDTTNEKYVAVWRYTGTEELYYRTYTVTTAGFSNDGTAAAIDSGQASNWNQHNSAVHYDPVSGKILVLAYFSSVTQCYVGTVSGTSVTWESAVSTGVTGAVARAGVDEYNSKFAIVTEDSSNTIQFHEGTITGSTIAFASPVTIVSSKEVPSVNFAKDTGMGLITCAHISGQRYQEHYIRAGGSDNRSKFIGIADDNYSAAATATIDCISGVNDNQTGLTTGTDYYISSAGALTTSSTDGFKVGIALSATEIHLNGSGGSGGGGGSSLGSTSVSQTMTPADNQVLVYDADASEWTAAELSTVMANSTNTIPGTPSTGTSSNTFDLSTGNVFNYTLAADTTVMSITNPATVDQFTAIIQGTTTVDSSTDFSHVQTFDYSTLSNPSSGTLEGIFWSHDGTYLYGVGRSDATSSDYIWQYECSTEWDMSTASYVGKYYIGSNNGYPCGGGISADGTKMIIADGSADQVELYTLSTAYTISTASLSGAITTASEINTPYGCSVSRDGTKVYVSGAHNGTDIVYQWTLSTPWSFASRTADGSYTTGSSRSINDCAINEDGTKLFISLNHGNGTNFDMIEEVTLSTPYDITSGATSSHILTNGEQNVTNQLIEGIFVDGARMWCAERTADTFQEYTIGGNGQMTWPSSVKFDKHSDYSELSSTQYGVINFHTVDGGTNWYAK